MLWATIDKFWHYVKLNEIKIAFRNKALKPLRTKFCVGRRIQDNLEVDKHKNFPISAESCYRLVEIPVD